VTQPVLFAEPGSTWWPVLWGPGFAIVGAMVQWATGPVHTLAWVLFAVAFAGGGAVWANGRRRLWSVELTPVTLRQGRETLDVEKIAAVGEEVGTPVAARVLGGSWAVPRTFEPVPVKLHDGTVVVAWARDGQALRAALRKLVES
jgi:hypothetical protein